MESFRKGKRFVTANYDVLKSRLAFFIYFLNMHLGVYTKNVCFTDINSRELFIYIYCVIFIGALFPLY